MMLFKRTLTLLLSLSLISLSFGPAHAAMVTNDQLINSAQQISAKDTLLQTIARGDVQAQLASLGVSSADLNGRINQLTAQEIAQLNQKIAELPAGSGVLGFVLAIFLIFVITDIIGATDVFSFVHSVD